MAQHLFMSLDCLIDIANLYLESKMRHLVSIAMCVAAYTAEASSIHRRQSSDTCTVSPLGNGADDVPQILDAFEQCGQGGTIVFPEDNAYNIASKLNPVVNDVTIEWRGTWQFSADLDYWRNNSYPIAFQNHAAGFILTGDGIRIEGYGTGGIDGNGDTWVSLRASTSWST